MRDTVCGSEVVTERLIETQRLRALPARHMGDHRQVNRILVIRRLVEEAIKEQDRLRVPLPCELGVGQAPQELGPEPQIALAGVPCPIAVAIEGQEWSAVERQRCLAGLPASLTAFQMIQGDLAEPLK